MKANQWTPLADRFWPRVAPVDANGCEVWTGPVYRHGGYGRLHLKGRQVKAHRVAFELTDGPIPPGLDVLHTCDNPPCCRRLHLYLGTDVDNSRDRETRGRGNHNGPRVGRHGRHARGDGHGARLHPEAVRRGEQATGARLTAAEVIEIRRRRGTGELLRVIAADYPIALVNIAKAACGDTWSHLPGAVPRSGIAAGDRHYRRQTG
jgi:hypothetical protein